MNSLFEIVQKIKECKTIAILYHINADGDAVGSALGLYLALSLLNKNVNIIAEEQVQNNLKFLPGCDKITLNTNIDNYDLVIVLDAGGLNRLGKRLDIYNSAKNTINVDHHISNNILAHLNYVDDKISSTGEIIYNIIKLVNIPIDKEIATCLYTAISTDTGNFKFNNTSSQTHRAVAELIDTGIDHSEITKNIYDNSPISKVKLLGKILDSMEFAFDNKVSILKITLDMLNQTGAKMEEADNFANYGLSIEGVELSILLKESVDNKTRVSLRSKNYFDCSEFARQFDGGGHVRAAGCDVESDIENARELLLSKIEI